MKRGAPPIPQKDGDGRRAVVFLVKDVPFPSDVDARIIRTPDELVPPLFHFFVQVVHKDIRQQWA